MYGGCIPCFHFRRRKNQVVNLHVGPRARLSSPLVSFVCKPLGLPPGRGFHTAAPLGQLGRRFLGVRANRFDSLTTNIVRWTSRSRRVLAQRQATPPNHQTRRVFLVCACGRPPRVGGWGKGRGAKGPEAQGPYRFFNAFVGDLFAFPVWP